MFQHLKSSTLNHNWSRCLLIYFSLNDGQFSNELWSFENAWNMATLQPLELSSSSTIFPLLNKNSCDYLQNMSIFVQNSCPFPQSPYGLDFAQILSIPANQLSLEIILNGDGSESLEEHLWKWHNSYQSTLHGFRSSMEGFRKGIS